METMMTYIKKEQEEILSLISNRKTIFANCINKISKNNFSRVLIYATGSSSNAVHASRLYMQSVLKIPVEIQEPSMSRNYEIILDDSVLKFAVSQSGSSYSTIELVKEHVRKGCNNIFSVTTNENSQLSRISPNVLDMGFGIEKVVFVTLGVVATTVYFDLLAVEIALAVNTITAEEYDIEIENIKNAVLEINNAIEKSEKWYSQISDEIEKSSRFVAISYGAGYGVAREAETKLSETVRVPTNSHELEEYMHGPYIGLNRNDYIFLICPNGKLKDRMNLLRVFLDNHVNNVFMIHSKAEEYLRNNDLDFESNVQELLSPICLFAPIHILAYKLSVYHNIDLTKSSYPDFDSMMKSKII